MRVPWRLIPHETGEGLANLAYDASLLEKALPFPILRFYSWKDPCISYGYFQTPPLSQIPAYRRVTGGGIVFHDTDLTYSLTHPRMSVLPWSLKESCQAIHGVIQRALWALGVETTFCLVSQQGKFCFAHPTCGDLLYRRKKIVGSAQRRKGNHLLHEGTILVDPLGIDRLRLMEAILQAFQETYGISFIPLKNGEKIGRDVL